MVRAAQPPILADEGLYGTALQLRRRNNLQPVSGRFITALLTRQVLRLSMVRAFNSFGCNLSSPRGLAGQDSEPLTLFARRLAVGFTDRCELHVHDPVGAVHGRYPKIPLTQYLQCVER